MAILYPVLVKITSLIERIISIVAPHRCLGCSAEDNILCLACQQELISRPAIFSVPIPGLSSVWVGGLYNGVLEKIIHQLKFERVRGAAEPLARILSGAVPRGDWLVIPIPTVSARVRQRGYDQAQLIAGQLAEKLDLPFSTLLRRARDSRQVGSGRAQRREQMQDAFYVADATAVVGRNVLLVDDVCTTGSTLSAAAKLLKVSGARSVSAAVCAWQPPSTIEP